MHMKKNLISMAAAVMIAASALSMPVLADQEKYLVLGQDLNDSEKAEVLSLLGIKDMDSVNVSYVTNQMEYEALGDYLSSDIIGTRALSSALVTSKGKGDGISVTTENITYCTPEMYQNALITAGVEDVDVKVAGPFRISGTAALVGIASIYEDMAHVDLDEERVDAANEELTATQNLGQEIGAKEASELLSTLKEQAARLGKNYSREDIQKMMEEYCREHTLTLTDDQKEMILDLIDRLSSLDIDVDSLLEQAGNIYQDLKDNVGITDKEITVDRGFFAGILEKISDFFDWLSGLLRK
jgi:uncharacterized protein YpuA (DUF1002 family)